MKSILIRVICLLTCVSACVRTGLAQGCAVTMTKNFSYYFTQSTDTVKIYTTVVIDGSSSCTPSPSCPCGSATHTPKAYNKLGSVGGWGSGTPQCTNCYLSYHNSQSIAATAGVQYPFVYAAQVDCSLGGTGFFLAGLFNAAIHWGHDYMWYDDPLPMGPINKCSWALADPTQCHQVCRAIVDPLTAPCYAGPTTFNSMLDQVPWVEVQLGSRVWGVGLNGSVFEVMQGSAGPPSACSSIPSHWGTSW